MFDVDVGCFSFNTVVSPVGNTPADFNGRGTEQSDDNVSIVKASLTNIPVNIWLFQPSSRKDIKERIAIADSTSTNSVDRRRSCRVVDIIS